MSLMHAIFKSPLRGVCSLSLVSLCFIGIGTTLNGCSAGLDTESLSAENRSEGNSEEVALANIRTILEQLESEGMHGVVQLKYGDDVLVYEGLGLRDRESNDPMQATTGFDIGSLTKAMTAATVLKLEEQGMLSLSDSISRFFPEAPSPLSDVTIQQLLEHRSGLPEYLGDDNELLTKEQALERLFTSDLQFASGSEEAYSNAGYSLLAIIVETASGQPFEQTMREEIFLPVNLSKIGYTLAGWDKGNLAVGYVDGEAKGTPLDKPWLSDGPSWTLRGNGGLIANAEDTANWFEAVFSGQVLNPASLEKFKEWFTGSGPYGVRVGEAGGDDLTGFNAQYEAWPDVDVSWTMFTSGSSYLAEDIWEQVEGSVEQLLEETSTAEPLTVEEEVETP